MNRLGLIVKREYMTTVMKKSFIVMTILIPILMIAVCGVLPALLANVKSDEKKTVEIVDRSEAQYSQYFQDNDDYHYSTVKLSADLSLYDYFEARGGQLYAIVEIPADVLETSQVGLYSSQSVNMTLEQNIGGQLRPILRDERLKVYGIDSLQSIYEHCDQRVDVNSIQWNEKGEENISSSAISAILGLVLALLTYTFVLMYGAMIMNGVIEEKANRIVEVIISSCKPIELMLGKIIGVALVGLTQVVIWAGMLAIAGTVLGINLMATPEVTTAMAEMEAVTQTADPTVMEKAMQMIMGINFTRIFVSFVLYFIGGYLLYASLFAAFGSAVDEASDASQFTWPIMVIMIFALYAGMFSMENPDGPLAWWCSMIPFTSPIVMMVRLPYDVPFWELATSVFLLYLVAFAVLWVASRIYRTGILMYGKKFTLKEILKWIKQ